MEWSWGMSLAHTDPTDLTDFAFDDDKSHGDWWNGRGACPSTPSAPISKAHTDSTRFNKKIRANLCKFVAEKKHQFNPLKSINTNFLNPYILSLVDLLTCRLF